MLCWIKYQCLACHRTIVFIFAVQRQRESRPPESNRIRSFGLPSQANEGSNVLLELTGSLIVAGALGDECLKRRSRNALNLS